MKRLEKDVLKAMDEDADLISSVAASVRNSNDDNNKPNDARNTTVCENKDIDGPQHQRPTTLNNKPLLRLSRGSSVDSQPPPPPRSPFQSNPLLTAHDYAKSPLMEGCPEPAAASACCESYYDNGDDDDDDINEDHQESSRDSCAPTSRLEAEVVEDNSSSSRSMSSDSPPASCEERSDDQKADAGGDAADLNMDRIQLIDGEKAGDGDEKPFGESTNVEEASTVQPTATSIVHDDAPDHVAANTTEQTGDKGKQEEEENDKGLKCRMSSGQVSFKQTECADLQ